MNTSRAALNILLNLDNTSATLNMIESTTKAVGKRLQLDLVEENDE